MTTYYKCVRLDGTDFRTGTVRWVPPGGIPEGGYVVTHPDSDRLALNDPATYLSVATVPTDCTGMRWPCSLISAEHFAVLAGPWHEAIGVPDPRGPDRRGRIAA